MLSALVFSTLLWLSLILALRFCLKLLLSYHQWMFEQHGRISNTTKVWVVRPFPTGVTAPSGGCAAEVAVGDFCVIIIFYLILRLLMWLVWLDLFTQSLLRLLSSRKPLLYSYQTSLPHLPVPAISDTVSRVSGHQNTVVAHVIS